MQPGNRQSDAGFHPAGKVRFFQIQYFLTSIRQIRIFISHFHSWLLPPPR
jgi:hypothetical protein